MGTVPAGSYQIVSDGKGCHKSWLQQLEPGSSEDTASTIVNYEVVKCIHCNCV
jgi:hypothetical protein